MSKSVRYNIYVDDKNDGRVGQKLKSINKLNHSSKIDSGLGYNSSLGSEVYAGNILSWIAVDVGIEDKFFKAYAELRDRYFNIIAPGFDELKGANLNLGDGMFYHLEHSPELISYYYELFHLLNKLSVKYALMIYDFLFNEYFRPRFHNDASYLEVFQNYELFQNFGKIYYRSFSDDLKLEMQNTKNASNYDFWFEFEKVYTEGSWPIFDFNLKKKMYHIIRRELRFARNHKSSSVNQFWNISESEDFKYEALMESLANNLGSDFQVNHIYYDEGIFDNLVKSSTSSKSQSREILTCVKSTNSFGVQIADLIVALSSVGLKKVWQVEQLYSNGYIKNSSFLVDNPDVWLDVFDSRISLHDENKLIYVFSAVESILAHGVIESASSLHMAPYLEEFMSLRDYYNGVKFVLKNNILSFDGRFRNAILYSRSEWDDNLSRARDDRLLKLK